MTINWLAVGVSLATTLITVLALTLMQRAISRWRETARAREKTQQHLESLVHLLQETAMHHQKRAQDAEQQRDEYRYQRDQLGEAAVKMTVAWHEALTAVKEPTPIFDRLVVRYALQRAHDGAEEAL